jgi:hypothetical protein
MTMQLYITYAGVTLDFNADGYTLLDGFYPDLKGKDRFELAVAGSSPSDLDGKVRAINLAFKHAREHKRDSNGAYLYFSPDETGTAWRSRLSDGQAQLDPKLSLRRRASKAKVLVTLERKPAWDGPVTAVSISNQHGSGISGVTVYNVQDAGHDSFVDVAAGLVLGDLAGPARLELTNLYASATRNLSSVWIGQNFTHPADFDHALEGVVTSIDLDNNETTLKTWSLSSAQLAAATGRYFKLMARFTTSPPNAWLRLKILWKTAPVWETGYARVDPSYAWAIRDLCTFQLPPWLPGQTGLDEISLVLLGKTTAAPVPVSMDWAQLVPLDGWYHVMPAGYGTPQAYRLVIDAADDLLYVDDGAGAHKAGIYLPGSGRPIHLEPGAAQRIYFLQHTDYSNEAYDAQSLSVKLFYRPRRVSI